MQRYKKVMYNYLFRWNNFMILTKKRAVAGAERRIFDFLGCGAKVADAEDKTAVSHSLAL
ncbi:hypothetical protein HMPREF0663_11464 [Hoylesella oralis ATCC 33269]|uniref:Uncharacterized protein n=1 Tax=Hoylesella oralis ATCC 33269 TaxID=873533 RepID=E7RQL3_9BACT|nr:hypothetical protein HMPREF0663_11464 [Hoylesella oralis ATCC 33269]